MKTDTNLGVAGSMATRSLLVLCLLSLAIIVWQQLAMISLRESNRETHWKVKEWEQLKTEVADLPKLRLIASEVEQLRQNNQELNRLRNEVGMSRSRASELEQLRLEVERLRSAQAEWQRQGLAAESRARAAERSAAILIADASDQCAGQLQQIGLAGRLWASQNNQALPVDFGSLHSLLNSPALLVCPADPNRQPVAAWEQLGPEGISYVLKGPGGSLAEPAQVFVECPLHGHACLNDGSVRKREPVGEN